MPRVWKRFRLSRESLFLVIIGLLDLATTLLWTRWHVAEEANPLFRRYLAMGIGWFVLAKLLMLGGPVQILEWARRRRPVFTRWASRAAIIGYVAVYTSGVARLNVEGYAPHHLGILTVADVSPEALHFNLTSRARNFKWAALLRDSANPFEE